MGTPMLLQCQAPTAQGSRFGNQKSGQHPEHSVHTATLSDLAQGLTEQSYDGARVTAECQRELGLQADLMTYTLDPYLLGRPPTRLVWATTWASSPPGDSHEQIRRQCGGSSCGGQPAGPAGGRSTRPGS